ncbi:uracil-DNA glycosylase family protein [Lacticaseibacillus kribbianus]|uniref:uracil-DNA glycosylase family protein n=1 Tax=Lacticaseibacillus kribbianus TaxID=2926292 RepID=UPI001CD41A37|nr:uracil-DNA glycosylase family protein [Lacticaseibacillus kribbianus]
MSQVPRVDAVDRLAAIDAAIQADPQNREFTSEGICPLYHITPDATILLISQAPSNKAQRSMVFWNDPSGVRLREWMGISDDEFYRSGKVAVMPLDFYYPGKGAHGDLPPRKGFAEKWHPKLLPLMPKVQLTLLVGAYAQKAYLGKRAAKSLTATVEQFADYAPYFPLVHPSPLNYGWLAKNPWFASSVVPALQAEVREALR